MALTSGGREGYVSGKVIMREEALLGRLRMYVDEVEGEGVVVTGRLVTPL